jgi:hypothetical protein
MFIHKSRHQMEVGPNHHTAELRVLVDVELEVGWISELVCRFWRRGKSLSPARDEKCVL